MYRLKTTGKDSDSSHMTKVAEVEKACGDLKLQVRILTAVT